MTTFNPDGTAASADDVDVPVSDDVFATPDPVAKTPAKQEPTVHVDKATEVAVVDEVKDVVLAEPQHQWMHDYLEFEGDKLEIRLPTEQALSAFSISVSKYMPADVQNDMVGLFIAKHMSPESYTHVMARMMDPDDATYNNRTVGELMGSISRASMAQRKAEADAKAEADKAAAQSK